MFAIRNITTLAVLLAIASNAIGDDWPIYRGDAQLRGVAHTDLPDKPELLWTFTTGEAIKSSPVIASGVVYVGSNDSHLYAINLADKTQRWKYKTDGPIESSPLVIGTTVYFGSWDGYFYAVNTETGMMRWRVETGERIIGGANHFMRGDKPMIVFGSYDGNLYCLDSSDGQIAWRYPTDNYINGTPAIDGERIIFGGCDEFIHVVSHGGKPLAKINATSYIAGSVALDGDRAWVGNMGNQFICIDLAGRFIDWSFEDRKFPFYASPALGADRVVFAGRDRRVYCRTRDEGEELWTFTTRGKVDASPVICGERVITASMDGRIYILNLADGAEQWRYDIGKDITASPAVGVGHLVVAAEDGNVYAFGQANNNDQVKAKP